MQTFRCRFELLPIWICKGQVACLGAGEFGSVSNISTVFSVCVALEGKPTYRGPGASLGLGPIAEVEQSHQLRCTLVSGVGPGGSLPRRYFCIHRPVCIWYDKMLALSILAPFDERSH
jgi:hypothetical protein